MAATGSRKGREGGESDSSIGLPEHGTELLESTALPKLKWRTTSGSSRLAGLRIA